MIPRIQGALGPLFLRDGAKRSLGRVLERQARKRPDQTLILFEGRALTYRQVNEAANRVAHFFIGRGYRRGDTVALFMQNRPEYLIVHAGLSKAGVIPALINTNLRGQVLVHAVSVVTARALICGGELIDAVCESEAAIRAAGPAELYIERGEAGMPIPPGLVDLDSELARQPVTDPSVEPPIRLGDTLEYIYTSGTTGRPKAGIITHKKWFQLGYALGGMSMSPLPGEVQYLCLPLYHNSGINIAWPLSLMWGGTLSLSRKFSAGRFWDEVRAAGAVRMIYVGELCRYLNQAPVRPDDADNPLRMILGNGMRAEYWSDFQKRFAIDRIIEVYGATEGVGGLINLSGEPGMIGRLSLLGLVRMGEVARYDAEAEALVRDDDGFAIRCRPGETGMFLAKINRLNRFSGYKNNPAATRSKLLTDVFKKGDAYFVSGDLFTLHDKGCVSFADRLGDTFKWKGEVVSTNEVADVVFRFPGVADANVYGAVVAGAEGRVGMAALTQAPGETLDLDALADHVIRNLPPYALPRMIRLPDQAEVTATFKQVKTRLKEEGFDPALIRDPLYFLDPDTNRYVPLTPTLFEAIQTGRVRF
ncbi:long-chain-acyl-CoA synthetase FadD6 [Desulfatiferula olefinivorans]